MKKWFYLHSVGTFPFSIQNINFFRFSSFDCDCFLWMWSECRRWAAILTINDHKFMIWSLIRQRIMKYSFSKSLINDCQLAISKAVSIALFLTPQSKNLHSEKYNKKMMRHASSIISFALDFIKGQRYFVICYRNEKIMMSTEHKIEMGVVDSIQFGLKIKKTLIHRMRFEFSYADASCNHYMILCDAIDS